MSNTRLQVDIGANTKDFEKGLQGVEARLKNFSANMQRAGKILSVGLTAPLVAFAAKSVQAFNIQAQAEQQLLVALGNRADVQQRLIQQAGELQNQTLFGDEETIKAQALIAAFVKEEEAIKRVIPLVQDMAQAKGMNLASAADLVAKTLGSSTNAMGRYGIEVTGAVGSSERLETLTKGLSEAFGGTAKAAALAGTGGITQLKNSFGDLQEQIGKIIYQQLDPFIKRLKDLTGSLQAMSDESKKNAIQIAAIGAAIGPVMLVLSALINSFFTLKNAAIKLFAVLRAHPFVIVATSMAALSTQAIIASSKFKAFGTDVKNAINTMGEGLTNQQITGLIAEQATRLDQLRNNFRGTTADAVEAHKAQVKAAEENLNALISIRDNRAMDELNTKIKNTTQSTKELNKELGKVFSREDVPGITPKGVTQKPDIPIGFMALYKDELEKMTPVQQRLFLANKKLEQSFQKIPTQYKSARDAALASLNEMSDATNNLAFATQFFVEGFAQGLANIIVEGGKLKHLLRSIGRELLKSGLTKLFSALLTGGLTTGEGLLGKGGDY